MAVGTSVVWDEEFTAYDFGPTHPMAPVRLDLTTRLARSLGVQHTSQFDELDDWEADRFDAVIDATSDEIMPALAVRFAKPAGRVVFIGLSEEPSTLDTRDIVFKDLDVIGILSASPGLAGAIESYASGAVVPDALVSEVIALEDVPDRLEGRRGAGAGAGPKVHVDPRPAG